MKISRVSLTMPQELLERSKEIAEENSEDRSTTLRGLLRLGIKQYLVEKGISLYAEGKVSLEKAAEIADVSLWKFLDMLKDKKIPLRYDLEDMKKEIRDICS
ncbi:MAG: UPF0175 family protein [Nanoarchaeota archaeon]